MFMTRSYQAEKYFLQPIPMSTGFLGIYYPQEIFEKVIVPHVIVEKVSNFTSKTYFAFFSQSNF